LKSALGIVMKEQMHHLYRIMLIIIITILQACGDSGDKTVFSISADITNVDFNSEYLQESTNTIAIQVDYVGDGLLVGFAPETEPVPWLTFRSENVTENSATVYINTTNAQFLPSNTIYRTKIRIATSNDDASKFAEHDIDVSLFIWEKVNFSGTFGDASILAKAITITGDDSEWAASTDVDWLSLEITAGTGNSTIVITPDISSFTAAGLQQGNVILTEATTGSNRSIPVDLALDNIYLFAERPTVSLTSTSTISALEATLAISSNHNELAIQWQATTEANWLTVTAMDDKHLHIVADPSIAPLNESSSTEVVVSASQDVTVISEIITINFYNTNLVVENKVLTAVAINNNEMLASPLKSSFYVAIGNQLVTHHEYTGEIESTLVVSPEGTELEQLIIHPNGDYLLAKAVETVIAEDESLSEVVHRYRIDLNDNNVIEIVEFDIVFEPTDIVRLSGRYFVVTQGLEFTNNNLQVQFWNADNAYLTSEIDVATQANTLFALDNNTVSFKRYSPQVNDFGDDKIIMTLTHEYHPELLEEGEFINDFIVTNDEANIYAISKTSEWLSFDGESFTDNGLLETNGDVATFFLEKNNDNQPNYLRADAVNFTGFYLDIYDNEQTITVSLFTQGRQPGGILLSEDDQRLILNVDSSNNPGVDSQIELITLSQ